MNNGPLLFFGILLTFVTSFWTLLVIPQVQIGARQPAPLDATGELYPHPRPGLAQQGAEVYRSLGCVECHTQQTRQTGVNFEVWLIDPGTNQPALAAVLALYGVGGADALKLFPQAPVKLIGGLDQPTAQSIASRLKIGEASAKVVLKTLGPDMVRGWGQRLTAVQDSLYDNPVQLGRVRVGPDLANYGARMPLDALVMQHLYEPRLTMPGSMMPPHRFLFTTGKISETTALPAGAVPLPNRGGQFIAPKPDALALVAYLRSLRAEVSLTEAPAPSVPAKNVPADAQPAAAK